MIDSFLDNSSVEYFFRATLTFNFGNLGQGRLGHLWYDVMKVGQVCVNTVKPIRL